MAFPTLAEALFQPGGEKTVQTGNDHRELMVTLAWMPDRGIDMAYISKNLLDFPNLAIGMISTEQLVPLKFSTRVVIKISLKLVF